MLLLYKHKIERVIVLKINVLKENCCLPQEHLSFLSCSAIGLWYIVGRAKQVCLAY